MNACAKCLMASTAVLGALAAGPVAAQADTYPGRPVKLVVPYPPGGGTDITSRAMAKRLTEFLGQPVIVENRPGATGMIGADSVAKSRPDGYTLLFGAASEMAINASLFKTMAYDPREDFEPVSLVASLPLVFVVPAANGATLGSMLEAARRKPGVVTYGSIGQGSPQHLAGELLESLAGVKLVHVPYKGSGPLVQDAIAGHVAMAISSVPPAVPLVKGGKLRALAVTSARRSSAMPDVPTVAELGYPGYEFNTWVAVSAPRGTPRAVVARLNEALTKTLAQPDIQAVLREQGAEPIGSTPESLRSFVLSEIAKADRIVKRADIRLD